MGKWILCKDELPPIDTNVLVCSGTRLKCIGGFTDGKVEEVNEYCVGYYNGIHTRKIWHSYKGETTEEDELYHRWVYNQGMSVDVKDPIAWSYIDEFIKGED